MAPHLASRGHERGEDRENGDREKPGDAYSCEGPAGKSPLDRYPDNVRRVYVVSYHALMPLFVSCPVGKLDRCGLQLTRGRDVNIILLERAPLGEDRMHRCSWVGWVFKVVMHQLLLRLGAGQKLDELDGIGAVLGVGGHTSARDVHVRPRRVLIGPEWCYWEIGIFRQQAPQIVGICEADIALTGGDGL